MNDTISIRPAATPDDYRALQAAQRAAWGITQEEYLLPIATMAGANLHGGLVLGAFLPDGRAVGLSFAFLGRWRGELCLYSQLTGVVPGHQDGGLGTRMKLAQRDFALRSGLSGIAWAFDPLRAGNARFNLSKLGARGVHYYVDMYGSRTDDLNRGAPTDRLLVWWPVSPEPRGGQDTASAAGLPRMVSAQGGRLQRGALEPNAAEALIEIPRDVGRLRREEPQVAGAWSEAVRDAFLGAFERGWVAFDFVAIGEGPAARLYYRVGSGAPA